MRIYNGLCKTLEQFQKNCEKFQKALSNKNLEVKFSEHVAHEPASASSSSGLVGRVQVVEKNNYLLKAWKQFLLLNREFGMRLDTSAVTLHMPAEVSFQRVFSNEDKKVLLNCLKNAPFLLAIQTSDGVILYGHLPMLPSFFHGASRYIRNRELDSDCRVHLEIDSVIANLFLDYCYGLPLSNLSLHELLQLHQFAEYTQSNELYTDTLAALMKCINDSNRDLILPILLHAILTRDECETLEDIISKMFNEIFLSKKETQRSLFKKAKDSATDNGFLMSLLGDFFWDGIGTPEDKQKAIKCYKVACNQGYFTALNFIDGEYLSLDMVHVHILNKKLTAILEHARDPALIQDFYNLLAQSSLEVRKALKVHLQTFKTTNKDNQAAIPFHLAIFYQEGIGVERSEKAALSLLQEAAGLGSQAARNYLEHQYPFTPILELYDVDVAFNTPEMCLEDLERLFDKMLLSSSPLEEKEFYNALKKFNLQVQQEFRLRLRDNVKMPHDPSITPIEKYHLARFYFEGLGGEIKKRSALELLKESVAGHNLRAVRYLKRINPNVGIKSDKDLRESFATIRRSPLSGTSFKRFNESLVKPPYQVPRGLLPNHEAFSLKQVAMGKMSEEAIELFLNFQLGLGIPSDTAFEHLMELYHLAYAHEIKDLLVIINNVMFEALDLNKEELIHLLLDLVILEDRPHSYRSTRYWFNYLDLVLKKTTQKTKSAFYNKLQTFSQENLVIQSLVATCYRDGIGVDTNQEAALRQFRIAAEKGCPLAQECLSDLLMNLKQTEEAIHWYQLAANQKMRYSQVQILDSQQNGNFIAKSKQECFRSLKELADEGYSYAQDLVSEAYSLGIGVEVDLVKAFEYLKLAVNNGYSPSLSLFANCYRKGEGVKEDQSMAFYYSREAADHGDLEALVYLANHYSEGLGVRKDSEKAVAFLREAANKGNADGQYNLGIAHHYGTLELSEAWAFHYFKLAADQNFAQAQYYVGEYYENGRIPNACLEGAISYYQLAAAQGEELAQVALRRLGVAIQN